MLRRHEARCSAHSERRKPLQCRHLTLRQIVNPQLATNESPPISRLDLSRQYEGGRHDLAGYCSIFGGGRSPQLRHEARLETLIYKVVAFQCQATYEVAGSCSIVLVVRQTDRFRIVIRESCC